MQEDQIKCIPEWLTLVAEELEDMALRLRVKCEVLCLGCLGCSECEEEDE